MTNQIRQKSNPFVIVKINITFITTLFIGNKTISADLNKFYKTELCGLSL